MGVFVALNLSFSRLPCFAMISEVSVKLYVVSVMHLCFHWRVIRLLALLSYEIDYFSLTTIEQDPLLKWSVMASSVCCLSLGCFSFVSVDSIFLAHVDWFCESTGYYEY